MLLKILKKDFERKKGIATALFIFIMMSAMLVASGTYIIMVMLNSIDGLFEAARIPHYVQMHSGDLNQSELDEFCKGNDLVEDQLTVKMLNISGNTLFLGNNQEAEVKSVMDISFVKQNKSFDFLLDLENTMIEVAQGEIAVPVYYMIKNDMKLGDLVKIKDGSFEMSFKVTDFVRDAQMNPTMVSSKRFVIHEDDYEMICENTGKIEYGIEFLLKDQSKINEFGNAYQAAGLPGKGPTIDKGTFKLLNAITDGLIAAVIILVSLLLVFISILCLRFTFLATIEEDYKEIGVMKAIGIRHKDIKDIYMIKYVILGALASFVGYCFSFYVGKLFMSNLFLYMGTTAVNLSHYVVPLLSVLLVYGILIVSCLVILKRFDKISAVEALRSGNTGEVIKQLKFFSLSKIEGISANVFIGIKDIFCRFKMYRLLLFIFILSVFIMVVPLNLSNTIHSDHFITYLGIGKSEIRIDLQQSDDIKQRYDEIIQYIKNDKDVALYSPTITCKYKVLGEDGLWENLNVETGDFLIFPLEYIKGTAPVDDSMIALSDLCASNLNKKVGDNITLMVNGTAKEMTVSSIYQDITNGGKTAKAVLPVDENTVLWYVISLDLNSGVNTSRKVDEYNQQFQSVKVTGLEDYLSQTLGGTLKQLDLVSAFAILVANFVAILITSLFITMLIAKESSQIAIMKSIGFSMKDIRIQYISRILVILVVGILVGTLASNTLGQALVSAVGSSFGASNIQFTIKPLEAYLLCPLLLFATVTITVLLSIIPMKKSSITEMIVE